MTTKTLRLLSRLDWAIATSLLMTLAMTLFTSSAGMAASSSIYGALA